MFETFGFETLTPVTASLYLALAIGAAFGVLAEITRFCLRRAVVGSDGEGTTQWQDWLEDESVNTAGDYEASDELTARREIMAEAMDVLNERERDILMQRRLSEETITLEDLSGQYDVSRERIRQIEVRAFEKLQKRMQELAREKGMLADA